MAEDARLGDKWEACMLFRDAYPGLLIYSDIRSLSCIVAGFFARGLYTKFDRLGRFLGAIFSLVYGGTYAKERTAMV
jgi:hypothetical protein